MDITGTIKVINAEQQISEKFKKREFVLTDNSSQYPQNLLIQLTQDRCALINNYKVGDEIKCHLNLRGREWTSPQGEVKYFNTIECWKIEGQTWSTEVKREPSPTPTPSTPPGDDLPF